MSERRLPVYGIKGVAARAGECPGLLASIVFGLYAPRATERARCAKTLRLVSERAAGLLAPYAGDLVVALESSGRKTRTEAVRALEALVEVVPEALVGCAGELAVSMHDPHSPHVRRGAFRALALLVGGLPDRAPVVWPWLDEALRVNHGDTAYPELLEAATGEALEVAPAEARRRLAELAALDSTDTRPEVRRLARRLLEYAEPV